MTRRTDETVYGESWEAVAGSHDSAARELDKLIESTTTCDCGHAANSLKHYDAVIHVAIQRWPAELLGALLAVAVTRLAGMKAGEQ
ncbi:hypothetical protein ACWFRF_20635 [Nocardia sp. NPDC055165]